MSKYDEVLKPFVSLMERELHANSGKGDRPGWLSMSAYDCMLEIYYHAAKLQKAIKDGNGDGIAEYSADVANMAMMVSDICGAIHLAAPVVERQSDMLDVSAERNAMQRQRDAALTELKRECDSVDEALRLFGVDPDDVRTDGGSLNLAKLKRHIAEQSAPVAVVLPEREHDKAYRNGLMQGYNLALNGSEQKYQDAIARYSKNEE